MISLIWKYYSEPVTVLPSKWLAPLERLVAFPTGVAGKDCTLEKKYISQAQEDANNVVRKSIHRLKALLLYVSYNSCNTRRSFKHLVSCFLCIQFLFI